MEGWVGSFVHIEVICENLNTNIGFDLATSKSLVPSAENMLAEMEILCT